MSYGNIKKGMAAALLLAFMTTPALAVSDYGSYSSPLMTGSMLLTGDVRLTDVNETITLSLRDSDIKQVMRMFADKANMNIVFHPSVSGQITLDLVSTPINEAFDLVLQIGGLNYYKQGNTMIVMSKNSPDNANFSKQEMLIFPINYVSADRIADFLNRNVFSMKKAGLSGVDAATVNSATNELIVFGMQSDIPIIEKVISQFDREPFTKTFAVNHTTPAEMANMICNMLLPARGIGAEKSDFKKDREPVQSNMPLLSYPTGGAAGVATGFAADSGEQISTDANGIKLGEGIVACSMSPVTSGSTVAPFEVQNLSIAYFPQRGTITLMGGSQAQAAMIEKFIKTNDVKQPQAVLELSIVELNEQGSRDFQNMWQLQSKNWGVRFDGSQVSGGRPGTANGGNYATKSRWVFNGGSNGQYDDNGNLVGWKNAAGQVDINAMPNGMPFVNNGSFTIPSITEQVYKVLSPSQVHVSWMMNYLVQNAKARVLANPKILITNGQESTIDLTQDYVEKVTAEYLTSSVNGNGSTGTAQRDYTIGSDLGIKVTLTPFISPEGYVTLNIKPNYSTIAGEVRTMSDVTGASELAATLLSRRDLDLKNVRIKDGETLVIGGLIQETESKSVNKVPFLGDLPLIGSAFRSTATSRTKSELVIMITPNIINEGEGSVAGNL